MSILTQLRSANAFELILEDGHLPAVGSATSVPRYSVSEECLKIAAKWLRECLNHHELCQTGEKVGLPSRVVGLGIEPDIRHSPHRHQRSCMCLYRTELLLGRRQDTDYNDREYFDPHDQSEVYVLAEGLPRSCDYYSSTEGPLCVDRRIVHHPG